MGIHIRSMRTDGMGWGGWGRKCPVGLRNDFGTAGRTSNYWATCNFTSKIILEGR
jgi:hypothetical protein